MLIASAAAPPFSVWNVVFTAIGVLVFWSKWGRTQLSVYGLSRVYRAFGARRRTLQFLELGTFVALGCLVGVAVVEPTNATQSLAAGLGWTSVFTQIPRQK